MSLEPTKGWWVHSEEYRAVMDRQDESAEKLRHIVLSGRVGIVEHCSQERQALLDSTEKVLASATLSLVKEEVA